MLWSNWWVFCEGTQNKCSNFVANSLESELWKNPSISPMSFPLGIVVGTFKKYPPCTWWIIGGWIEKFFKKYPPWAWWVTGGQIVSELTMNSPWACQVNTPSPPVTDKGRGSIYWVTVWLLGEGSDLYEQSKFIDWYLAMCTQVWVFRCLDERWWDVRKGKRVQVTLL